MNTLEKAHGFTLFPLSDATANRAFANRQLRGASWMILLLISETLAFEEA